MSTPSLPGRLIVVEAIDLAGKTTQLVALAAALHERGMQVALTGYPDRDAPITGNLIDRFLAGPEALPLVDGLSSGNEEARAAANYRRMLLGQSLFALNRRELAPRLEMLLSQHHVVLSSRYQLSGRTYALATGLRSADIDTLLQSLEGDLRRPDLNLVIDIDPSSVLDRPRAGGLDSFERDRGLQQRVRELYREQADKADDILIVSGAGAPEEITARLIEALVGRYPDLA